MQRWTGRRAGGRPQGGVASSTSVTSFIKFILYFCKVCVCVCVGHEGVSDVLPQTCRLACCKREEEERQEGEGVGRGRRGRGRGEGRSLLHF